MTLWIIKFVTVLGLFARASTALDWWENGNFYQIYPRSFKDSNGDGIGDLKGITEMLPYLQELGITGVWLSPIFTSPMADAGYDISDFYNINPDFGTMSDFDNMADKCKELGIRLILDFVPNHTSDEHDWFIRSELKEDGYADRYIWHPGKLNAAGDRVPPNNWLSAFRFSGWKWSTVREEYYFHQFVEKQPDLNYRNSDVADGMKDVLRFWLARGVSGFRIDAVPHLFEIAPDADGNLPDEPPSGVCTDDPDAFCSLSHIYTQNQPETFDMVYQWRQVMDDFKTLNGGDTRILMTEAYTSLDYLMQFYTNGAGRMGSHIPFNFELLLNVNRGSTAKDFKTYSDRWLNAMPSGFHANWVLGNHDNHRVASRFGTAKIDLLNILLKTLPGIAITYMGEELGMTNVHVSWSDTRDPQACNTNEEIYHENSRDPARTPFQWDASRNAGFSKSTGKLWLPVSPNYKNINVAAQRLMPRSHLKVFKKLIAARKDASLTTGGYDSQLIGDDVLIYKREATGSNPYVIVLNFGQSVTTIDLKSHFTALPDNLTVVTASILSQYTDGAIVSSSKIIIRPEQGVVFTV